MPEFPTPNPDFTKEQALTMILSSIALEEVALSHIINAEGEKIQFVLNQANAEGQPASIQDILAVNRSVTNLLDMVFQNQIILRNKMAKCLEYLPRPLDPREPPDPPIPPIPPIPPVPPIPPWCGGCSCCCQEKRLCFFAVSKAYRFKEALRWKTTEIECNLCDCSKISLPCSGFFEVELHLEGNCFTRLPGEVHLAIHCKNKRNILKKFCIEHSDNCGCIRQCAVVEAPEDSTCFLTVSVSSQWGIDIRNGSLLLTKR